MMATIKATAAGLWSPAYIPRTPSAKSRAAPAPASAPASTQSNGLRSTAKRRPRRLIHLNCEAPSSTSVSLSTRVEESEWDKDREGQGGGGGDDAADGQQFDGQAFADIQPVFVEEIQQQDTVTDHLSPSSLTPAMTADGGNMDMRYLLTRRLPMQM